MAYDLMTAARNFAKGRAALVVRRGRTLSDDSLTQLSPAKIPTNAAIAATCKVDGIGGIMHVGLGQGIRCRGG